MLTLCIYSSYSIQEMEDFIQQSQFPKILNRKTERIEFSDFGKPLAEENLKKIIKLSSFSRQSELQIITQI